MALIVIDGSGDGVGKQTQIEKLYNRLVVDSKKVKKIEYPNYDSDSSALIKMYLSGKFGSNPNDVDCYAASLFYAVDRFASFKQEWEKDYLNGVNILADRYMTSNMIYQSAKINDISEENEYLEWLIELEFEKLKLPRPDCVIILSMPPEFNFNLMKNRNNKFTGKSEKDIHEKNEEYLINVFNKTQLLANEYEWKVVNCVKDGQLRSIDDIHEEIYNIVKEYL